MAEPYTAVATSTGDGREGHVTTTDGALDLAFAIPGSGQPGVNPEQLFAAGWSACFHSALKAVARKQKVTLTDSAVVAEVTLNSGDDRPYLSAALHVEMGGVDQATADSIVAGAHALCPYSKATRNNIDVTVQATVG